jgi:hypothetical protein
LDVHRKLGATHPKISSWWIKKIFSLTEHFRAMEKKEESGLDNKKDALDARTDDT